MIKIKIFFLNCNYAVQQNSTFPAQAIYRVEEVCTVQAIFVVISLVNVLIII